MKKILLLSSILLLSAVWAVAQYGSQPSTSSDTSSQSSANSGSQTLQGCLGGSDGNFTLTDQSGTTYRLSGDTSKMQAHVGHTVQVTGTSASGASPTSSQTGSMSGSADSAHNFNVSSFKHVSGSCSK